MEAIKFSELPTGDRMPLADEDGVPIIANQENRLLTWGRLKKQLADQTHTDEVKPSETKVPTGAAVENRIKAAEDDLQTKLESLETKLNEHDTAIASAITTANEAKTAADSAYGMANVAAATAEDAVDAAATAQNKADNAALAASQAQTAANSAKADAERFESELDGKISAISTAQGQLRTDLDAETAARETALAAVSSSVTAVSSRITNIETKIENGEIGGGGNNTEVDLTPVTDRLTALEAKDTTHDNEISALQTKTTANANKVEAVETQLGNLTPTIQALNKSVTDLQSATTITDADGEAITVADAISEAKTAASTAQTAAETAQTTATTAKNKAETLEGTVADLTEQMTSLAQSIIANGNYTGWQVEITAGSIDDENGLMIGAPSFTAVTEGIEEGMPMSEAIALIFRNQEAMYQILIDARKRAIANATNLTAMLTNINAVLSQVMN